MAANDDIARFSTLLRAKDEAEQQQKDAERARIRRERELARAQDAKAAAAQELKAVRQRKHTDDELRGAETRYRIALADLLELEQGERPAWAPVPVSVVGEVDEALQGGEVEGVTAHQDEVSDPGVEVGAGVSVGPDEG